MNLAQVRSLAQDVGFVLNPVGQLVVPAPEHDATKYLRKFAKRLTEVERGMPPARDVTQEMLNAAMKKAVETGLVAKHLDPDTYLKQWDAIKACLQAALAAA